MSNQRRSSKGSTSGKRKLEMRIPILDLKSLQTALVLCRPSKVIKSAYVADVIKVEAYPHVETLLQKHYIDAPPQPASPRPKKGKNTVQEFLDNLPNVDTVLAHAPSLDCAGMVMPGTKVWCSVSSATSKTQLVIQQCEEIREDGTFTRVGYHPQLAESICRKLLVDRHLENDFLGNYETVEQQKTYGNSRVDFVLTSKTSTKTKTLVEVKNVVGADYPAGEVPATRGTVGVYEKVTSGGQRYRRAAIFPHGSHKPGIKVVSTRAIKHVHELTNLHGTTDDDGFLIKSAIIFVVNRADCEYFRPCQEADMLFSQVLKRAISKGVQVLAKEVVWEEEVCYLGKSLPVAFDPEVDHLAIDDAHLQSVLDYDAELVDGRPPVGQKKKKNFDTTKVKSETLDMKKDAAIKKKTTSVTQKTIKDTADKTKKYS